MTDLDVSEPSIIRPRGLHSRPRALDSDSEDEYVIEDSHEEDVVDSFDVNDDWHRRQLNNSTSKSEDGPSVVDLTSEDEDASDGRSQQTVTLKKLMNEVDNGKGEKLVSGVEYDAHKEQIFRLESDLHKCDKTMRSVDMSKLPDGGKSLRDKRKALVALLEKQNNILNSMVINEAAGPSTARNKNDVAWDEIHEGVGAVGPKTFGKKGIANFNAQKQLAVEALDSLHKSLDSRPGENDFAEDPSGLKVPLMQHQRRALAWILWREGENPSGGLLADDMGLGKTLTMISLIMQMNELEATTDSGKEKQRDKYPGGTLVVCPASLLNQWSGEIKTRTRRGLLDVEIHHGNKRETRSKKLAKHDIVITTYTIILNENNNDGCIFGVCWRRIILDEAHQIRNFKSKTAEAAFRLSSKSRWCLTGTPIHNKEMDMFAIMKFLRCSPFDELATWKSWLGNKSNFGEQRLHAVISSLMLRRTKAELIEAGSLQDLPPRNWELIPLKLSRDEMNVYQKVLIFSRTLFAQFLHQRAEKNQDAMDLKFCHMPQDPNGEYQKMRSKLLKMNGIKQVNQHDILLLLLRLRQICVHPCLIKEMLRGDEDLGAAEDDEDAEEMNLLDQLNKLNINDDEFSAEGACAATVGLGEATKNFLNPSNPVFKPDVPSTKIKVLVETLKEKISSGDKAIVVSQWTSVLKIVASHIKDEINFSELNGEIPVHKRSEIVDSFNDKNTNTRVLLLSLTAGGVGLNLIGANHLFLLDLHWNPQLEKQAQDRIYRMGQTKPIFVYKLIAEETIEARIKTLQEQKLSIADSMLTGSKRVNDGKLSLQDLKMLFGFSH